MKDDILVSVVLPVYNTPETILREAVQSILSQTYKNFELILVNDGSEEECRKALDSFQDDRIKRIDHIKNLRLPATLNHGIKTARGKYIVRMDSDDISMPDRIKCQVEFMENNPQVDIAGTLAKIIGTNRIIGKIFDCSSDEFQVRLLFGNSGPVHPTVIMKSDFLRRNNLQYNEKMKDAEDYDLWVRAAKCGTIKGINKVLLKYRWSEGQVSQRASESMRYTETRISHRQLESILGRKMDNEESEAFYKFRHYQSTMDFKTMDRLLGEALKKNKKKRVFNQELLKHYFAMYWLIIMRKRIVSKDTKDIFCLGQTLRALNPWNIYFSVLHKRREKYGRED